VARLLDANRLTLRNGRAIPIRAETRVRSLLRTQHRSSGNEAQQGHDEQNAHDVSAGRIPLRPVHFLILARVAECSAWSGNEGVLDKRVILDKSRARLASPQPRPTSPVNGAGGITGCRNDAKPPGLVPRSRIFFCPGRIIFNTRLIDFCAPNPSLRVAF